MMYGAPNFAPGSRDPGTGESRPGQWATEREMEALIYLAASTAGVSPEALGRDLAHDGESMVHGACLGRGHRLLQVLREHGLASTPRVGCHVLTERGRIAAALILFRHRAMLPAYFDED